MLQNVKNILKFCDANIVVFFFIGTRYHELKHWILLVHRLIAKQMTFHTLLVVILLMFTRNENQQLNGISCSCYSDTIGIITRYCHYNTIFWSKIFIIPKIQCRIPSSQPNLAFVASFKRWESQQPVMVQLLNLHQMMENCMQIKRIYHNSIMVCVTAYMCIYY